MKVAFVGHFYPDRITGPRGSVTLLANAVSDANLAKTYVYSFIKIQPFYFNDVLIENIHYDELLSCDFVIISAYFGYEVFKLAKWLRNNKIPYIVSPRSSFSKYSMSSAPVKKYIYNLTFGKYIINNAAGFHFLNSNELNESFFEMGDRKFFISPNGLPHSDFSVSDLSKNVIGYIGRYDINHKGLDLLLDAVSQLKDRFRETGWRVSLYGADYRNGKLYIDSFVRREGIGDIVTCNQPVMGNTKYLALNDMSVFIHTSRYEGEPQSVLEAIKAGLPVAVTRGTNMVETVIENQLGWCSENNTKAIVKMLENILSQSLDNLNKISNNANIYAVKRFDLSLIARDFISSVKSVF